MRNLRIIFAVMILTASGALAAAPAHCAVPGSSRAQPGYSSTGARPWFGATIYELTEEAVDNLGLDSAGGVIITGISDDGPAATAGLFPGDVIVRVDGVKISGTDDFASIINTSRPGQTVTLGISRQGKLENVYVTLSALPAELLGSGVIYGQSSARTCPEPYPGRRTPGVCPPESAFSEYGSMKNRYGRDYHGHGLSHRYPGTFDCSVAAGGARFVEKFYTLVRMLELTEAQEKSAEEIISAYEKSLIKLRAAVQLSEVELQELLSATPADLARVRAKIFESGEKMSELKFLPIMTIEDLKGILRPEQLEELEGISPRPYLFGFPGIE